jgi:hypothetical protein
LPICPKCASAVAEGVSVCPFCQRALPGAGSADAGPFREPPLDVAYPAYPMAPPGGPLGPPDVSGPARSRVDTFEDGLVPFLGDPNASKLSGRLLQFAAGVLVLYNLVRAVLFTDAAILSQQVLDGTNTTTPETLIDLGHLIDTTTVVFWPSLVVVLVLDLVWRRSRRPKGVLQSHGEAYVEATLNRCTPVLARVGFALPCAIAVVVGLSSNSAHVRAADIPGNMTARAVASFAWAIGWVGLIALVWFSERHLARRVAKAADPMLAAYTVPYVEPEPAGTIGESAGPAWIFRTAGLVLLGLVGLAFALGGLLELPSGKETGVDLVFVLLGGAALGFVGWRFARRFGRAKPARGGLTR